MDKSLSFTEYFINIARMTALRSKDPNTKVGCVIVNSENRIISTGYNGFPSGFPDWPTIWASNQKYKYVIHAEANALLHASGSVKNCTVYTTLIPCSECTKLLLTAGISTVYYLEHRECAITKKLISLSGKEKIKYLHIQKQGIEKGR